jgi:hypothetical protein
MLIFTVFGSVTWFYAEFTRDRGRHRIFTVSDQRGLESSLQVSGCDFEGFGDFFKAAAVVAKIRDSLLVTVEVGLVNKPQQELSGEAIWKVVSPCFLRASCSSMCSPMMRLSGSHGWLRKSSFKLSGGADELTPWVGTGRVG